MLYQNKTVGIWGYGRVGKAAAVFFQQQGARIVLYDDHPISVPDSFIKQTTSLEQFFEQAEFIVPSPGVDIRPYKDLYKGEWLAELDLFQHHFHKPIIAVSGSIGKTTVAHLLAYALTQSGWRTQAAGNIGIAALSMIETQDDLDAIVLEVSSFQLEHTKTFAPDLAIWTNFHPNHLDRHETMQEYFDAKYHLKKYQTAEQNALLPLALRHDMMQRKPRSALTFFSEQSYDISPLFYLKDNAIWHRSNNHSKQIIGLHELDHSVFPINWLTVYAAVSLLKAVPKSIPIAPPLEHRLERVNKIGTVTFYNDSKSTTPASTLAALASIKTKQVILFLGGLSKGIDRTTLMQSLQGTSTYVVCFGAEAEALHTACTTHGVRAKPFSNLEDAFHHCTTIMKPNDTVLFSPAGSSFDLFRDYQERGNRFKELVNTLQ